MTCYSVEIMMWLVTVFGAGRGQGLISSVSLGDLEEEPEIYDQK